MTVKLLDYASNPVEVDVGDIETIGAMSIRVITGDEILQVIYKDFSTAEFDSSNCRFSDFFDNFYDIYNATTGLNLFDMDEFINRTSSYWYEDVNWEVP